MCFEAGLVHGEELFFDSTKVKANADIDSLEVPGGNAPERVVRRIFDPKRKRGRTAGRDRVRHPPHLRRRSTDRSK
jgi:hypothetical protein